jgi:hypothetical protein
VSSQPVDYQLAEFCCCRRWVKAFTRKHDPYWDIPLNENLPQPAIDLPIPAAPAGEAPRPRTGELFDFLPTGAPAGSGALFAGQQITPQKRTAKKK